MKPERFERRLARRAVWGLWVTGGLPGCLAPALDGPPIPRPEYPYRPAFESPQSPKAPRAQVDGGAVTPASGAQPAGPQPGAPLQPPRPADPTRPLEVPRGLPGAETPELVVPPDKPETKTERLKVIDALFPELPPLSRDPVVDGLPGARVVTLEEMLDYARKNSPEIAQATADVEDARGRWVQVGLYPNPTMGFQGDQIADGGPFGQFGGFFNQTIVTAGKLKIARSVVYFDYLNARARLRRAEVELARRVRTEFYAVLVAAESVRVGRLLVGFTDEVYRRQVALVKGGTAAPFEASALLALTGQAELTLVQARNRHASAWRQLAATINAPEMPPTPLAGQADEALPRFHYEALRERLVATHTDLVAARNMATQAERSLVHERVRPIPDIQNQWYFQDDTFIKSFQFGAQIGVQVPLFNKNQGGIMSAKAQVARAGWEVPRVQNTLLQQLADAYERYENARQQIALYRTQILPNLVTAFRGVYQRYQVEPDKVNYNDIVTAQQNLSVQLAAYLQALRLQWQAVGDLAGVVQVIDPKELLQELNTPIPDTWPEPTSRGGGPQKK
ncbi:MAG: czcC 2 [Gemmataceae bacterium]|nr:czcC 2 [Gemmataceae bacterium]